MYNPRTQYSPKTIRLAIVSILAFVLVILAIVLVIRYLTTAELTVTANGDYTIVVTSTGLSKSQAYTKSGLRKLSVRLHSGSYSVLVRSSLFATERTVIIKARANQSIKMTLTNIGTIEPVSTRAASDLAVDSNGYSFVDLNDNQLFSVNTQNIEQQLSTYSFARVKWASRSYGIAQDSSGSLYLINNGAVEKVQLSISPSSNNYALAPDQKLFVSDGYSVYYGSIGGSFTKIFSGKSVSIGSASNSEVLVQSASSANDETSSLKLVTVSGKIYSSVGDFYDSAWSPNGNYVAITSDNSTAIYNSRFELVDSLPTSNVNSPVWVNNDYFVYGVAGYLWSYSLAQKSATLSVNISNIGYVSQITPSPDGSYVYLLVQNTELTSGNFQLVRLGLLNQPVSAVMQQLQVILPNTDSGCNIGYEYFSSPTVVVSGVDSGSQTCIQVADSYLQLYGVNTSLVNVVNSVQ